MEDIKKSLDTLDHEQNVIDTECNSEDNSITTCFIDFLRNCRKIYFKYSKTASCRIKRF